MVSKQKTARIKCKWKHHIFSVRHSESKKKVLLSRDAVLSLLLPGEAESKEIHFMVEANYS